MSGCYHLRNIGQMDVSIPADRPLLRHRQHLAMKSKVKRNYLSEWRRHRHLTQDGLAAAAGTTKATISRLESGQRGLSQKWLERLAPALSAKPAELLDDPKAVRPATDTVRTVPLLNTIQAGRWHPVTDGGSRSEDYPQIPLPQRAGPRSFALTVSGPSMEPDFRARDVIIVDPDLQPQPGDFVVATIEDENEATFKRLRIKGADSKGRPIIELVPLNLDWPVLSLKNGRIVGVAVDLIRRLR